MSKQREDDYDSIQTPQDAQTPQVAQAASTAVPLPPMEKATDDEFSFASMYHYADGKDKRLLAIGLLCAAVNGSALPFMAVVFGNSVNAFVAPIDFDKVHTVTLEFLVMAIGLFVTGYGFFACFAITAERQMKKLRGEFFKHIMHQEMAWYDQRNASELASRLAGDTIKMKEGMGTKLGEALRFVCQFVAGYAIGFSYGWNLSLVMCCVMPLLALSLTLLMKRVRDSAVRSQQGYAAAGAVAEETIGAMRTVASLNGEERALAKYAQSIAKVETETIGGSKFVAFAQSWFTASIWLTYVIGLWYGGWLVSKQNHAVSDPGTVFSAFYGILMGTTSLAQVTPSLNAVASAKGAATAIFNILARKSQIDASNLSGEVPSTCEGNIEVRDVYFAYPSRPEDPILRGYSLTIHKGETVAFVGASGSGKSTLVALLERFYQPTSGAIYLDGRDISTLQLQWLRSQIGLVSQEPVLFATTIFENIAAGGDDISRDQVIAAAKLANAHDFIMGLPDGYDTMCGEKGATLSGGQKQRVAIARALVREPKILVLDEATSALDNESERVVQAAINNLMAHTDMTTIVIAHRLSTIRSADKIAVISNGVVAELGRHDDLMRMENGFYRSLVEVQLSSHKLDEDGSHGVEITAKSESMDGRNKADTATLEPKLVNAVDGEVIEHTKVNVGRIFDLTKPQRMYLIAGTIACSVQGFAMPSIAMVISKVIHDMNKHYADFVASGKKDMEPLTALYDDVSYSALIFLGVAAAIFVAAFVSIYSFRIVAEKLTTRLRNLHFEALLRQEIGFFDRPGNTTGALTTDLSSLATKVVAIAGDNQAKMLQALFTIVSALVAAFIVGSWKLTLVTTAACPLLLVGSYARAKQLKGGNFSDNLADSGSLAAEAIANARTVAAFGLEQEIAARYEASLEKPLKDGVKEAHGNGFMEGIASFSMFAVYALVFSYGGHLLDDGSISFKQLMNTLMVVMMAAQSVGQSASIFGERDIAKKSAAKIFSIVDRQPPVDPSSTDGLKPVNVIGHIEFKDVSFHYPSRPDVKVLQHYDLTIEPGQTVAFCGPSGGGKSTCVALLERFYNPTSGSITLDGRDISTLNLHWLRSQIGLVGQEPVLFVGTIAENIASGLSDYTSLPDLQERVEEAAKMANAHNFIMQFPDGYETQVGLKGEQLSGGQKQRIAIARAIMKNPSILLLDEATSALDSESEKVVQEALDELLAAKGRTTIVIAHRLSTIRHADKICVVSGGRIAEQGTHDQLMKHNGIYAHLVTAYKL